MLKTQGLILGRCLHALRPNKNILICDKYYILLLLCVFGIPRLVSSLDCVYLNLQLKQTTEILKNI